MNSTTLPTSYSLEGGVATSLSGEISRPMTSAIPHPTPSPRTPPPAAATPPAPAPASATASAIPSHVQAALAANVFRYQMVTERLEKYLSGELPFQTADFVASVFSLAKAIDYSLAGNDLPAIAACLPSVIKQVYQHRKEAGLQSAITVLIISAKNACKSGWFNAADTAELLSMANELFSSFCMSLGYMLEADSASDIISKIMPRFYPQLKLGCMIISLQAKPGYDTLVADFLIPRNVSAEERIRLFVIQTDNLETSSCLVSPPLVSLLVNGKGVERRTNVSLDNGPQFPTDITKMLKYGTNIIQAIGYFKGNYIIAIAFTNNVESFAPILEDYVQPVVEAPTSDSELIVGASRISTNCPISFRRIKTPVKGRLCKHHQCFDYDNFMEMNSRKPSWRCPCCNQPVSCIDLRIDQNMVKILREIEDDVNDVVINDDGTWKVFVVCNGDMDRLSNGVLEGNKDGDMDCEPERPKMVTDVMDLTMEEAGECNAAIHSRQGLKNSSINQSNGANSEAEDRKPIRDIQELPIPEILSEAAVVNSISASSQVTAYPTEDFWLRMLASALATNASSTATTGSSVHAVGTSSSIVPDVFLRSVTTDAVSPALNREDGGSVSVSQPTSYFQQESQVSQLAENMQLQQASYGNSIISSATERPAIPRHVTRTPIAVQALPVQTHIPSSSQRMRTSVSNFGSTIPNGNSVSFQPGPSAGATLDGHNLRNGGIEIQQALRNSDRDSLSLQIPSRTQMFPAPNHQNQQYSQHIRNATASQQVIALAAPNLIGTRASTSNHQRGAGAYRALSQAPADLHSSHHPLPNFSRSHPTTTQTTTTANLQSSCIPSTQLQQVSDRTSAVVSRFLSMVRPQSGAALSQMPRSLSSIPQTSAAFLQPPRSSVPSLPQTGAALLQAPRSSSSPIPQTSDGLRFSSSELQHSTMVTSPTVAKSDGIPELPSEQNWRPTGRMRGSLTGSAYEAALSHYLSPAAQTAVSRSSTAVSAPLSYQPPILHPNSNKQDKNPSGI